MFGEHLQDARILMEIKRYQNRYKHKTRSVAEHSWFVSKIAHGLALWEKYKFENDEVDIEKIMFMGLNHDIVEGFTGDILTTTKKLSLVLKKELERVEEEIFSNHIINTLPKSWGDMYIRLHQDMTERQCINSKIVKASDLLDRVFECLEEIELQNETPYRQILAEDIQTLYDMDIMSVKYFMKYAFKDFGADQYVPQVIQEELDQMDFSPYF